MTRFGNGNGHGIGLVFVHEGAINLRQRSVIFLGEPVYLAMAC